MRLSHLVILCLILTFAASLSQAEERQSTKVRNAENVTVFMRPQVYACFPFLPKTQPEDGVYISAATRKNMSHNDATGGVTVMRSTDGCRTWSVFREYPHSFSPEETNAIQKLKTANGTLVDIHTGWEYFPRARREELVQAGWDVADAGDAGVAALSAHSVKISCDDGRTWESRQLPLPNASGIMGFHGGIVTDQDIILWPVYGQALPGDLGHSYVYRSADSGKTWTFHEIIADSRGELPMNETSLLDIGGGHILAFVRTGDSVDHMFRAESVNGGITWGRWRDSGIKGHPPDLLRLRNGHILLTYGYRHKPFGIRAAISEDNGQTWGDEHILRDDGTGSDLGYPMSLQLPDETIFTTYYFRAPGVPSHIAGTLWREPEYGFPAKRFSALPKEVARPELVQEVLDGKRHEALASWWGFDPNDSTEFLQKAIHSNVRKLIVDRQASAWMTRPLAGVSDQEIVLEAGTELVALKGAFRGKGECLLTFRECCNVIVRGQTKLNDRPARIRMYKEDYQSDNYEKSEWRHGLSFASCRNVLIQDVVIEQTGGDGIYLGVSGDKVPNQDVVIRRVDCNDNHRQGISVISAENLLIEDCLLQNTDGTAPQAGIDFEPNHWKDVLVNCLVRRCLAEHNSGTGYQICPQYLSSRSKPMTIYLEDCVSHNNKQHGIHLCTAQQDAPGGLLRIVRFVSDKDRMAGLSSQFNPYNTLRIEMVDSVLRDCAHKDSFFPPIFVQGVTSDDRPGGNIHFQNVVVKDDISRPFFRISDPKGNGLKHITGNIILERKGQKETIVLNDAWLQKLSPKPQQP